MFFIVMIGDACNLNCKYCFEHNKLGKNTVKVEHVKKFIDYVFSERNPLKTEKDEDVTLFFHGGEPFLYIDTIDQITELFLEGCKNFGFPVKPQVGIVTNATLIDQEKVRTYMQKYKDLLIMGYSIDGEKGVHDKNRLDVNGNPTYDKVWNNFNNRIKAKVDQVKYTINADNVLHLAETLEKWGNLDDPDIISVPSIDMTTDFYLDDMYLLGDQLDKIINWYTTQPKEWVVHNNIDTARSECTSQFSAELLGYVVCKHHTICIDTDGSILKCALCAMMMNTNERDIYGHADDMEHVNWDDLVVTRRYGDPYLCYYRDPVCYRCPIGIYCGKCCYRNEQEYGDKLKWNKTVCNLNAFMQMLDTFLVNYKIKTAKEIGYTLKDTLVVNKTRNVLVPKVWALEFMHESIYNYICKLTEEVGGFVTPLETKYYSWKQVYTIKDEYKNRTKGNK